MGEIAEVVFDLRLDRTFHYRVPPRLRGELAPGKRVRVPFRAGYRTGICVGFAERTEVPYLKDISAVLDEDPLITPEILRITRWVADEVLCSWGTALRAAVPPAARSSKMPRTIPYVELTGDPGTPVRSERQARVLEVLARAGAPIAWKVLAQQTGAARSNIDSLARRGLVRWKHVRRSSDLFSVPPPEFAREVTLNPHQETSLERIRRTLDARTHRTFLLFGVTGSGKTEVYLRAMEHATRKGMGSIFLVPEIALTPQTIGRVRARFPGTAVLHSKLTPADRAEEWRRIRRGEAQVVVGVRSAVFAPVKNLGLIIVDEEHEPTYKQESDPRYHAREVAIQRGAFEQAVVVLGSATPAVETFHRAREGRFELLELPERVQRLPMPGIRIVDMQAEARPGRPVPVISKALEEAVREAVGRGEQAILFLNRRGYATYARCPACGWVARCERCDTSLHYHRDTERWMCHYCLSDRPLPDPCPRCQARALRPFGIGTQRVESECRRLFGGMVIGRMDSDAMKTREDYRESLESLRRGDTDILIGTQMIAKGLDIPNVTVVGVVSADTAFHVPDFRAAERTFQLVIQVAGRAGRSPKGGTVYVQTMHPQHPSIACAAKYNYSGFAERELRQRRDAGYPPFSRLIRFVLEGRDEGTLREASSELADRVRRLVPADAAEILGPSAAPLGRIRNRHRRHILVKAFRAEDVGHRIRKLDWRPPAKISLTVDVDPQSLL